MNSKLRSTVEALFEAAPKTRRAYDLKEELISNLTDKYNDLIAQGKAPDEAYNNVVASIGDVDELIMGLEQSNPFNRENEEKARKKTALVVTGAVGLYIFSVISLITMIEIFNVDEVLSTVFFLFIVGVATCILIYYFMSRPTYKKIDDTLVEEFKEWKQDNSQKHQLYKACSSIMWTLITAIYLIFSFALGIWSYSWIIFIIGAVIEQIIKLIFDMSNMKG